MSSHSNINILGITDLHLGHPHIPPVRLYEHLIKYVYPKLKDIHLLIIGGDFFDRLCNLNGDSGIYAVIIVDDLVRLASTYGFYIRVVRGTFSHDRYQNRLFLTKGKEHLQIHNKPLVRVLDNIELEIFDDLKISVVYCPDDQPHADVTQAVIDVIEAHKLKQIDILCSHGYWEHLLPRGLTQLPHNTLLYDRLGPYIRGAVINGHVHTMNIYKKVFNCGSFERFQHGEEEKKGCFLLHYRLKDRKLTYEFIENQEATPFVTLDLSDTFGSIELDLEEIIRVINDLRSKYNDPNLRIHLRLVENSDTLVPYVKENFPNVVVTKKSTAMQEVNTEELHQILDDLPIITEDNLPSMISQAIQSSECPLTEQEVKEILDATTDRS